MGRADWTIGGATPRPGEVVRGELPVLDLPTGGHESLPVLVAQGREVDGPTLWLTANIHGAELTGIPVIHRIIGGDLAGRLRGTVVALPTLNPAGLRTAQRTAYYGPGDPNRTWPQRRPEGGASFATPLPGSGPAGQGPLAGAGPYERIAMQVYEQVARRGDYLLDLHNAAIRTIPFTIVDRVLYAGERDRPRAVVLGGRLEALAGALGLSVVREAPAEKYVGQSLHRSVSGAFVNVLGIPALTVELGLTGAVDPTAVEAGVTAVRNALRHLGMLPGEPEPVVTHPVVTLPYPVRRDDIARAPRAGLLAPALEPGAPFAAGQPLAGLVDLWGESLPGSEIAAPADGWLIGWYDGLAKYAGQPVAALAIRDDAPLVAPHPVP